MRNCATHHHACDCREERIKTLEAENEKLKQGVKSSIDVFVLDTYRDRKGAGFQNDIREYITETDYNLILTQDNYYKARLIVSGDKAGDSGAEGE